MLDLRKIREASPKKHLRRDRGDLRGGGVALLLRIPDIGYVARDS